MAQRQPTSKSPQKKKDFLGGSIYWLLKKLLFFCGRGNFCSLALTTGIFATVVFCIFLYACLYTPYSEQHQRDEMRASTQQSRISVFYDAFYEKLFQEAPDTRQLFEGNMVRQGRALVKVSFCLRSFGALARGSTRCTRNCSGEVLLETENRSLCSGWRGGVHMLRINCPHAPTK